MRRILTIVNFMLCLELMLAPLGQGMMFSNEAHAQSCPPGTSMNTTLNRCLTSDQVAAINNSSKACNGMSGNDQKKCYRDNAQAVLDQAQNDGKVKKGNTNLGEKASLVNAATGTAIAVPLFMLTYTMVKKGKGHAENKTPFCKPASLLFMYAGAVVLGLGEVITYFTHKKKLKNIQEDYKKIANPTGEGSKDTQKGQATEAQSQAFEALAKNEDSIASTAKTKFMYYAAATGMFAAGTVMAVWEAMQMKKKQAAMVAAAGTPAGPGLALDAKTYSDKVTCNKGSSSMDKDTDKYNEGVKKYNDSLPIPKKTSFQMEKLQRISISNVSKSKDMYEALEQIYEYQNIEFENYSRISYVDADLNFSELKNIKVDKFITSILIDSFIPNAHALRNTNIIVRDPSTPEAQQILEAHSPGSTPTSAPSAPVAPPSSAPIATTPPVSTPATPGSIPPQNMPANVSKYTETATDGSSKSWEYNNNSNGNQNVAEQIKEPMQAVKDAGGNPVKQEQMQNLEKSSGDKWDRAISSPYTRIAINGVLGTWIGFMSAKMKQQQKISEERAKYLRSIKDDFNHTAGIYSCTDDQRNNPGNTTCYCYTSEGQRNPNRTNSANCQKLWTGKSYAATNYAAISTTRACVTQSGQMDPSCNCRSQQGANGRNTCMNVNSRTSGAGNINPGTFKMLNAGAGPANDLLGGNISAGQVNGDAAFNNAAQIRNAAEKMLAATDPKMAPKVDKLEKEMERSLAAEGKGLTMGGASGLGGSESPSMGSMNPQQAAAELEREFAKAESIGIPASNGPSGPEADLNFGFDDSKGNKELAAAMDQDLDFAGSDINSGTSSNIFEVLSNRYQRSGMRRLFDESGNNRKDAPAESDIAE